MSTETERERYDLVNQAITQVEKWASHPDNGWAPSRGQASVLAREVETLRRELGAAIDEVYAMRALAAHDALILAEHLDYKSFPKSRRRFAEMQIERLRGIARGGALRMRSEYPGLRAESKRDLEEVGADSTLTTSAWRAERQR